MFDDAPLFAPPREKRALTVGELTALIKGVLQETFAQVAVHGELSEVKKWSSGHIYFTLKDSHSEAILRCKLWKGSAARLRFDLADGMAVVIRGEIDVYPPRGEYSLICREIEPVGQGTLELAFRQLKEKLAARGWFAPERKRPLPPFPRRIGIVTSPSGAAIRDLLLVLGKRWPAAEVIFHPALVQGDGAAASIAGAVRTLNQLREPIDVMIVGRGGGSLEDLWAFNEEIVAQAIFESEVPIVSAVGHETDFTIADFVADVRAATPSEAAALVAPDRLEFVRRLQTLRRQLAHLLRRQVTGRAERLRALVRRRCFTHPLDLVQRLRQDVDGMRLGLERHAKRLAHLVGQLESLSPLKVLARGYAIVENGDTGMPVRSVKQVRVKMPVRVRLTDGRFISRVESLES
jgi:exodeoxyribonuclease VII large subunit